MIVLGYIGDHKGDGFKALAGWALIRLAQTGREFQAVTHTEILLAGDCNAATIASATMLDGGVVRIKEGVQLNPLHWLAFELPDTESRSTEKSAQWFAEHLGELYDRRGALGSVLLGFGHRLFEWFCNEACGKSMGQTDPQKAPPAGYFAWLKDLGAKDITREFFRGSRYFEGGL